jgi:hypothetical protein
MRVYIMNHCMNLRASVSKIESSSHSVDSQGGIFGTGGAKNWGSILVYGGRYEEQAKCIKKGGIYGFH